MRRCLRHRKLLCREPSCRKPSPPRTSYYTDTTDDGLDTLYTPGVVGTGIGYDPPLSYEPTPAYVEPRCDPEPGSSSGIGYETTTDTPPSYDSYSAPSSYDSYGSSGSDSYSSPSSSYDSGSYDSGSSSSDSGYSGGSCD